MVDDAGIGPKAAHELVSRQVGVSLNLSYTLRDHKNYLRANIGRWHMAKQNAIKHLGGEKNEENNEDTSILSDFSACMYEDEDMVEFDIMRAKNAIKHLGGEKNKENNEDTSILSDFSACMYEYEDMVEFDIMRAKLFKVTNEYLVGDFTYEEEYKVINDPLKQTIECSCRQFDRIGYCVAML
ncbi:hypothetical protein OsI_38282 [Oryza sativa Indica Group]|uniref:Uncharacterized protein n=1 Tax=Oryza sativa subsp. indica TaxID=39946 RepID=B8BPK4_ORYSI|nr:hypothetical protein OsI_38282 [Oryza sativa Indica Group]